MIEPVFELISPNEPAIRQLAVCCQGDPTAYELERAVVSAVDHLAGRMDIDPQTKQAFLLLLHAAEKYGRTFGAWRRAETEKWIAYCRFCFLRTRQMALQESLDAGFRSVPRLNRQEFCAASRLDRIRIQSALIARNRRDMETVYQAMARLVLFAQGPILNVGDKPPLESTFLRRILHQLPENEEVHTIDVDPSVGDLTQALDGRYMHFSCQDGTALAFSDGCFYRSLASYMIDDCSQPKRLLEEMCRVTRRGELLALSGHRTDPQNPVSAWVYNYGDLHMYPTAPETIESVAASMPLSLEDRLVLPHAWCLMFRKVF